jgi:hypothetical protein
MMNEEAIIRDAIQEGDNGRIKISNQDIILLMKLQDYHSLAVNGCLAAQPHLF